MSVLIQLRRDTAANWSTSNPILAQGEPALETNTGKLKVGDGSTAWNSLNYWEAPQPTAGASLGLVIALS